MSCSTCYQARPLPRCLGEINIGSIPDSATDVTIRIKSSAGRIDYKDVTSDGTGNIIVDLTGFELAEMVYEFQVFKKSDRSIYTLTMADAATSECVEVAFEDGEADSVVIEPRA
jgi:hypothetical protein